MRITCWGQGLGKWWRGVLLAWRGVAWCCRVSLLLLLHAAIREREREISVERPHLARVLPLSTLHPTLSEKTLLTNLAHPHLCNNTFTSVGMCRGPISHNSLLVRLALGGMDGFEVSFQSQFSPQWSQWWRGLWSKVFWMHIFYHQHGVFQIEVWSSNAEGESVHTLDVISVSRLSIVTWRNGDAMAVKDCLGESNEPNLIQIINV